jgi:hypothetical protein
MLRYIFPIIKKKKEEEERKKQEDYRIPLYESDIININSYPPDDATNIKKGYVDIDYNIDNKSIKL